MPFMIWKDDYDTGIPEVDEQHHAIFAAIERLHDSATNGCDRTVGMQLLNDLVLYADKHFDLEEGLMAAGEFPGIDEHRQQHHEARQVVHRFRNDYLNGRVVPSIEVLDFLKKWLDDHILGTDFQYVRHLKARGMA